MIELLVVALVIGALYGLAVPAVATVVVAYFTSVTLGVQFNMLVLLALLAFGLFIPVTVASVARITGSIALGEQLNSSLVLFALVAGASILLSSDKLVVSLVDTTASLSVSNPSIIVQSVLKLFGVGFSLVAVLSFLITALCVLCELPFVIIGGSLFSVSIHSLISGLRPVVLILVLIAIFQVLVQVFIEYL